MEDIVARLRSLVGDYIGDADIDDYLNDAADEIERLCAENARLKEALEGVIRIADRDCPEFRAARAALAEQEKTSG